jgi:hypothetical protein
MKLLRIFSAAMVFSAVGCGINLVNVVVVPDVAPITDLGNRCLIVYESADVAKMPAKQQVIITGSRVRKYLDIACIKNGWRIVDADTEFTGGDDVIWVEAMRLPRDGGPWLICSTGKKGFSGPLPDDIDTTIELLATYFEAK